MTSETPKSETTTSETRRPLASSPCMMAEFAESDDVCVFYLQIEESETGFAWQVRRHDHEQPVEIGLRSFRSDHEARAAGQPALDRVCQRFLQFGFP